jgi:hypothetical protein
LASRRAEVLGRPAKEPWLKICIDRVNDPEVGRTLLAMPLEDWGVQLFVGCSPEAAAVFGEYARRYPTRVSIGRLEGFTPTERDDYLKRRIDDAWAQVPADLRALLRIPYLASLYCELFGEIHGWEPRSEYELIERFWRRLTEQANFASDERRLRRLAGMVWDGGAYPWDGDSLAQAGLEDATILRLINVGWLRLAPDHRFEIPHDRLLSFAIVPADSFGNAHRRSPRHFFRREPLDENRAAFSFSGNELRHTRSFDGTWQNARFRRE